MKKPIDDETLVSFLDGELTQTERESLEQQIAGDQHLQQRIQGLQQTWEMLVDLPQETPNPDLTRSTIELVTLELEQNRQGSRSSFLKLKRPLLMFAALCVGAGLLGAVASRYGNAFRNNLLEENLAFIADYDSLKQIDDNAWIEELMKIENLKVAFPGKRFGEELVPLTNSAEKQAWIENLEPVEQGLLKEQFERFVADQDKSKLLALELIVDSDPEKRTSAVATVRSFAALLNNFSTHFPDLLNAETDLAKRRKQIEAIVLLRMRAIYPTLMSETDRIAIFEWVLTNSISPTNQEDLLNPDVIEDWRLEELLKSMSEDSNKLLQVGADEQNPVTDEDRYTIATWVKAVLNAEPETSPTDELLSKLEALGKDLTQMNELQRIELLPEERARKELERLVEEEASK
ncbi:MAG: hypothetical protein VXZ82_04210 [Planctomycetota bacterium]|nr:hypothetical protein [Planctomycetota bacterium]